MGSFRRGILFFRSQEVILESRPGLLGNMYPIKQYFLIRFGFWVITSDGAGVSSSQFGRHFLLGLLYLPIPTRTGFKRQ